MVLTDTGSTRHFRFLLLPGVSPLTLSSVTEPLRVANYLTGRSLYAWRLVSPDGRAVTDDAGLRVLVDGGLPATPYDVVVCGGSVRTPAPAGCSARLRALAAADVLLAGVAAGTWLLAEVGALDGHQCAVRWSRCAEFLTAYPATIPGKHLFCIDRRRASCIGGTAVMDMMLGLIGEEHGRVLAAEIAEMLILDGVRGRHERQRLPRRRALRGARPRLVEAVAIMEANLQEPLGLEEVARYVGTSQRQLARLFQGQLRCSPSRFYLILRLSRAREMLRRTALPVDQVATACGFASTSHFSTRYRSHFGVSPSEGRRGLRAVARAAQPLPVPMADPSTGSEGMAAMA